MPYEYLLGAFSCKALPVHSSRVALQLCYDLLLLQSSIVVVLLLVAVAPTPAAVVGQQRRITAKCVV